MVKGQAIAFMLAVCVLLLAEPLRAEEIIEGIESVSVEFDIQPDYSVKQKTSYYFSSPVSGVLNYTLGEKVSGVKAWAGEQQLVHGIASSDGKYVLHISVPEGTRNLTISYVSDRAVFQSGSVSHFFTELRFGSPVAQLDAKVKLPEGYAIYQDSYRPYGAGISSDGRRIILGWELLDIDQALFSVKYARGGVESWLWLFAAAVIAAVAAGIVFVMFASFRRKEKDAFLKGFREDEKRAVLFLQQRKVAFQRDLQRELQFSRAKATRIVRTLEQKGLLKKEEQGRTNRLLWLK
ncbi:hypothetical protein HYU15_00295 [Candidatus Woesearchaeota archaeon]|nr:hypothetical protein [Candidatus Woesearchaeota archaeon]